MTVRRAPAPLVSVAMAAYNRERHVADAIESVLAQTLSDLELIVVDDGSTDGTLATIQRYARSDPRVRVSTQPNAGPAAARNAAIAQARGEFVAMMDHDDLSRPRRLESQVAYLRRHPEFFAVACRYELVDDDGNVLKTVCNGQTSQSPGLPLETLVRGMLTINPMGTFRRSMWPGPLYRPFFLRAEDYDLALRVAETYWIGQITGETLYGYRHGAGGASNIMYRDAGLVWIDRCAALLSAHCRREGLPDPVEAAGEAGTRRPRDLLPRCAELPHPVKALCLRSASSPARRLIGAGRAEEAVAIARDVRAMVTTRADARVAGKVLAKILFYALGRRRWRSAARLARLLREVRAAP